MEKLNAQVINQTYKISAVSYLNTKPFLYGLEHTAIRDEIMITQDSPALCAEKLMSNEVDIGLVPVAVIPKLLNPQIVAPFCIGADGNVATVCLFSAVPMEAIETVYLDYQSRTSVELVKILFNEYWNRDVTFVKAFPGYESEIKGTCAGVIIGDRAIHFADKFKYVYDLSKGWKELTGLPFVFAAWVSCRELDAAFLLRFREALQFGLDHRTRLLEEYAHLNTAHFTVENYLFQNLQYELDAPKQQALELFINKLQPEKSVVYCFQ
ncbi:MAG: menaquinone biosynthesis protein [Chitinophagales bacterium]